MPATRTVSDWTADDPDFAAAYARARSEGYDAMAAECKAIADDGTRDYTKDGRINKEHVQRSKLRIETRLRLLRCWDPKRYGDKIIQEHTGPEGKPLLPVAALKLHNLTDEELTTLQSLMEKANAP